MLKKMIYAAGIGYLFRRFVGGGRSAGYSTLDGGGSRWGRRGW